MICSKKRKTPAPSHWWYGSDTGIADEQLRKRLLERSNSGWGCPFFLLLLLPARFRFRSGGNGLSPGSMRGANQTTFAIFWVFCIPQILAVWVGDGVFQQPRLFSSVVVQYYGRKGRCAKLAPVHRAYTRH